MANLYFRHISMKNFMSYKNADIDLNRSGNVLVGGINKNPEDGAKSNGCGKSTIFSALTWALTGETVNGAKEVSNIYSDGKTEVTVMFDIDNTSYKITRTKGPSNLFFYVNDENLSGKGVRDTAQIINHYLPQLTSSLINSVIILGQGLPQKFTNNTPSGRKDVLEKLSNSEFMIEDLKSKLSNRKHKLFEDKRSCEDFALQYETTKKTLENQIKKHEEDLLYLEDEETLEKAIKSLESDIDKLSIEQQDVKNDIEALNDILEDKKKYYENLIEDKNNDVIVLQDCSLLGEKLIDLKSKHNSLIRKISEYENVRDVCPTCGQKLPDVHKIDTTDLRIEQKDLEDSIKNLETDINTIKSKNESKVTEFNNKWDSKIRDALTEINLADKNYKDKSSMLNSINSELLIKESKKNEIVVQKATLNERRQSIEHEIFIKKEFIKKHEDELYNNSVELETINKRISINAKMLSLIQRDFRGHLLSNIISFIEDKSKEYSLSVFGTDKLTFKLEKNNINISYDGKDYSCLSGGEKQKLDIIIQFAIRDMLCTFLDFSSNILVLDEITDALDSIGVSKIFNLINENLSDVEAIYIISHHVDELEIPADDEIIIIKGDDKISRIV